MSALKGALTVLLGKQLKVWLGAGLLALISVVNSASAQTVDVLNNNVTSVSGVGFNLLNLGSATASGFQSSSTLTNQTRGGLPTPTGTEITNIAFAGSNSPTYPSGVYAGGVKDIAASPISTSTPPPIQISCRGGEFQQRGNGDRQLFGPAVRATDLVGHDRVG